MLSAGILANMQSTKKKQDIASLKADVDKGRNFNSGKFSYNGHDGKANDRKFLGIANKNAILDVR